MCFHVLRVSYLHSHAMCSTKLLNELFCCLCSFILFICGIETKRKEINKYTVGSNQGLGVC